MAAPGYPVRTCRAKASQSGYPGHSGRQVINDLKTLKIVEDECGCSSGYILSLNQARCFGQMVSFYLRPKTMIKGELSPGEH